MTCSWCDQPIAASAKVGPVELHGCDLHYGSPEIERQRWARGVVTTLYPGVIAQWKKGPRTPSREWLASQEMIDTVGEPFGRAIISTDPRDLIGSGLAATLGPTAVLVWSHLDRHVVDDIDHLAQQLGIKPDVVRNAIERLCRNGIAVVGVDIDGQPGDCLGLVSAPCEFEPTPR